MVDIYPDSKMEDEERIHVWCVCYGNHQLEFWYQKEDDSWDVYFDVPYEIDFRTRLVNAYKYLFNRCHTEMLAFNREQIQELARVLTKEGQREVWVDPYKKKIDARKVTLNELMGELWEQEKGEKKILKEAINNLPERVTNRIIKERAIEDLKEERKYTLPLRKRIKNWIMLVLLENFIK